MSRLTKKYNNFHVEELKSHFVQLDQRQPESELRVNMYTLFQEILFSKNAYQIKYIKCKIMFFILT